VDAEVILQHGWAFDGQIWDAWLPVLERAGAATQVGERGYFGVEPRSPRFTEQAQIRIIVAHSLGLHLLDPEVLANADALLIISGFLKFHPDNPMEQRRSQRVIKTMLSKFSEAPDVVLSDFWKNAYAPEHSHIPLVTRTDGDVQRLAEDLERLHVCNMGIDVIGDKPILFVSGDADRIVSRAVFENFVESAHSCDGYTLKGAGHAIPVTRAAECISLLKWLLGSTKKRKLIHVGPTHS
jgi:pimeloyl-[acyl-carrier protein] methyl ester esterase